MSSLKKLGAYKGLTQEERQIIKDIEASFVDKTKSKTVKKKSFAPSSLGWKASVLVHGSLSSKEPTSRKQLHLSPPPI